MTEAARPTRCELCFERLVVLVLFDGLLLGLLIVDGIRPQAPSWKQLLILLTRMSESRIEPSVDALVANKETLRLRTVVQFIRVSDVSFSNFILPTDG